MLENLRNRIARLLEVRPASPAAAPRSSGTRMYAAARQSRLTAGWTTMQNSSADAELNSSLTMLRARTRALMRDSGYAKRARVIVVNNVIGAGVGLQAQVMNTRKELRAAVNEVIETAFAEWSLAENCHTGGALHFADFERAAMGQVFETGEAFIRVHPRAFALSRVPLALELVEAERLAEQYAAPVGTSRGTQVKMGVELDAFQRAVAYWVRDDHPGEVRTSPAATTKLTRVPAEFMFHLRVIDRWPQTRGEPWLHAAAKKLHDMDEYSGSELDAARMSANYFATIESTENDSIPLADGTGTSVDNPYTTEISPGIIEQLRPGEELKFHAPNRPNAAIDPFMRMMLREVAAAIGVSYESLSRDYSQSNYSSSRLALLDDRDLWRVLQQWWVRCFRAPLHRMWVERAVYARALESIRIDEYVAAPEKFNTARWKLRGWNWIDPTKEVEAAKAAVRAGFTTVSQIIEQTGNGLDIEDVIEQRKQELEMFADAGYEVETTVTDQAEAKAKEAAAAEQAKAAEAKAAEEKETAEKSETETENLARQYQDNIASLQRYR